MKTQKIPIMLLIFFTILLFQNNFMIQKTIIFSCELFLTKIVPSLFPMMILSDLFIYFGLPELLCKYLGTFFEKIFHVSSYGAFAFFISCFSGTPSNAYVIASLVSQNYLTEEEASKILSFSFFSNPLFLYSMLSFIFPNHPVLVLKIILLPYFVNILIAIFQKPVKTTIHKIEKKEKLSFGLFLTNSIKKAMNTLLFVLGSICLFLLINTLLNPNHSLLFSGFLEISQGLNALISSPYSLKEKTLFSVFMISFGGLSIHLQIKGIISETQISYIEFLKGRIKQTIFSLFIAFFFL